MTEDDLIWLLNLFRNFVKNDESTPFFEKVDAMTWFREPDFHPDYRRLHELEKELNDGFSYRFELLSIWRLARDEGYAKWAKEIGTKACQITFFGMQDNNDWFYRRKGSFRDNITATERLLDAGISPRWQLFLTKRIIPELPEILKLVDQMRLYERTEAIGGNFDIFLHTPAPDGEAWNIEHLRPTVSDLDLVPTELKECSEKYLGHPLGEPEGKLISKMLKEEPSFPSSYTYPDNLGFYITSQFDVFTNFGDLTPYWKLGNLRRNSLDSIINRFESNSIIGLWVTYSKSTVELAKNFGRHYGRRVYTPDDLKVRLARMCCQSLA